MAEKKESLLKHYFNCGVLNKRYYSAAGYRQPFSAEDRLAAGSRFYADYLKWRKGERLVGAYDHPRVDCSFIVGLPRPGGERFRRALRFLSEAYLPVVYKVVLEEEEIKAPSFFSAREKLYFSDEIKGLLCRGLDELCVYYRKQRYG